MALHSRDEAATSKNHAVSKPHPNSSDEETVTPYWKRNGSIRFGSLLLTLPTREFTRRKVISSKRRREATPSAKIGSLQRQMGQAAGLLTRSMLIVGGPAYPACDHPSAEGGLDARRRLKNTIFYWYKS
jgi:hypothetical protein